MGVGEKPKGWDLADYVLGRFSQKDAEAVEEAADRAADAVRMVISEGPDAAMNSFNGGKKEERKVKKLPESATDKSSSFRERAAESVKENQA